MKFIKWKTLLFLLLFSTIAIGQTNPNHVYVEGYYRKDGTYVQGHYRTAPNHTNRDNFSTEGNYNPYTGEAGHVEPDNKVNTNGSVHINPLKSSDRPVNYEGTTNSKGEKVITYSNGYEVFGLCKNCRNINYNEKLTYFWYSPYAGVQKTQGESGGILLDGTYKLFENEKLRMKINYKKGLMDGDCIFWDIKGKITDKMHYTAGIMDYAKFSNDSGNVVEWIGPFYKKGSIRNIYTSYGNLIEQAVVGDNLRMHYKGYNEISGQLEIEFTSLGDIYYGPYQTYYENGKTKFMGHFSDNGYRDSTWYWYDREGNIESTLKYKVYTEKYPDGELKVMGSMYFDDENEQWVRDGSWEFYQANGISEEKFYLDGEEVDVRD